MQPERGRDARQPLAAHRLRCREQRRYREIDIVIGTGSVSELTDADIAGLNAFMLGVMSEFRIIS